MKTLESKLQIECVKEFRKTYTKEIIFAVPNGGYRKGFGGEILRREGVLSGVSDLIIISKNKVIFIEMKYGTNKQSPNQITFQEKVESLGFKYYLCNSFDEFKQICKNELK